jgi:hypothetical protein
MMLVLTLIDGHPVAALVDRRLTFFQVHVAADLAYFDGTVALGEYVHPLVAGAANGEIDTTQATVWFHEVQRDRGNPTIELDFMQRYGMMHNMFRQPPPANADVAQRAQHATDTFSIVCTTPGIDFRPKVFFPPRDLPMLLRALEVPGPFPCDGVVLMPVDEPVVRGTHRTQFKWKAEDTVDLVLRVLRPRPDAPAVAPFPQLLFRTRSPAGEAILQDLITTGILLNEGAYTGARTLPAQPVVQRFIFQRNALLDRFVAHREALPTGPGGPLALECLVECRLLLLDPSLSQVALDALQPVPMALEVLRIRHDKAEPNNDFTTQQTILTRRSNITPQDLMTAFGLTAEQQHDQVGWAT